MTEPKLQREPWGFVQKGDWRKMSPLHFLHFLLLWGTYVCYLSNITSDKEIAHHNRQGNTDYIYSMRHTVCIKGHWVSFSYNCLCTICSACHWHCFINGLTSLVFDIKPMFCPRNSEIALANLCPVVHSTASIKMSKNASMMWHSKGLQINCRDNTWHKIQSPHSDILLHKKQSWKGMFHFSFHSSSVVLIYNKVSEVQLFQSW